MKTIFKIISISFLLLALTSFLSYNDDRPVDGLETYGFPFTIYQCCSDCVAGFENGYVWENVFKNLLIYGLLYYLILLLFRKLTRLNK